MSSHGRRGQHPEPAGPGQLGWALLVVAAALIGGLAAAALVHTSITIAVIVSLVAGGIALLVVFRSPSGPPELTNGELTNGELTNGEPADADLGRYATVPRRPMPPDAHDPRSVPPPAGPDGQARGGTPAGHETAVQLLPLGSTPGGVAGSGPPGAPWWDSAQGAPPAPSPGAKRVPAPDLSTYLAATVIAQCPRCGGFGLDIRRARDGWDFRCESCEYTWTWQPGTPWPPVRVMPGERRESRPPAP